MNHFSNRSRPESHLRGVSFCAAVWVFWLQYLKQPLENHKLCIFASPVSSPYKTFVVLRLWRIASPDGTASTPLTLLGPASFSHSPFFHLSGPVGVCATSLLAPLQLCAAAHRSGSGLTEQDYIQSDGRGRPEGEKKNNSSEC